MKIILLRHGESEWNLENRFTGWHDVDLTKNGIKEAEFAGKKILNENLIINSITSSILKRAVSTTRIVSKVLNFDEDQIQYSWRLNERHYGALQGLNKSETAKKYGEEKVLMWRRSYDTRPPLLDSNDARHPKFNRKFKLIDSEIPAGESLKDVSIRIKPFLDDFFNKIKDSTESHLIIAHSNSLRALVMIFEKLSKKDIINLNIPTGVPLVYEFDKNQNFLKKKYLVNNDILERKQNKVINQGKINEK